jgi:hypothetical protein
MDPPNFNLDSVSAAKAHGHTLSAGTTWPDYYSLRRLFAVSSCQHSMVESSRCCLASTWAVAHTADLLAEYAFPCLPLRAWRGHAREHALFAGLNTTSICNDQAWTLHFAQQNLL